MRASTTFNRAEAERVIEELDRDTARFFAGRKPEQEAFKAALAAATRGRPEDRPRRATVFRVFQGPPGAGKSSLLQCLEQNHAKEGHAFVRVDKTEPAYAGEPGFLPCC